MLRTRFGIAFLSATAVLLSATPVPAHHSFAAEYDSEKPVTVEGVVTEVKWVNPHAYVYVKATGQDGEDVLWGFEALSPNALARQGWRGDSLEVGERVTIEGFLAKDGLPLADGSGAIHANSRRITRADGQAIFSGRAPR